MLAVNGNFSSYCVHLPVCNLQTVKIYHEGFLPARITIVGTTFAKQMSFPIIIFHVKMPPAHEVWSWSLWGQGVILTEIVTQQCFVLAQSVTWLKSRGGLKNKHTYWNWNIFCIFQNDFKLRIAHFRLAIISSNGYCVLDTEHRIKKRRWGEEGRVLLWMRFLYIGNRQAQGIVYICTWHWVGESQRYSEAENKTSAHSGSVAGSQSVCKCTTQFQNRQKRVR